MIENSILNIINDDLIDILLFRISKFSLEINFSVTKASVNYIISSERFDKSLFAQ